LQRYSAAFGEKNKQQSNRNGRYDWIFKLKVKAEAGSNLSDHLKCHIPCFIKSKIGIPAKSSKS
jgi:hypothetical protein